MPHPIIDLTAVSDVRRQGTPIWELRHCGEALRGAVALQHRASQPVTNIRISSSHGRGWPNPETGCLLRANSTDAGWMRLKSLRPRLRTQCSRFVMQYLRWRTRSGRPSALVGRQPPQSANS